MRNSNANIRPMPGTPYIIRRCAKIWCSAKNHAVRFFMDIYNNILHFTFIIALRHEMTIFK
ncbi:hypothetical protein DRQ36_08255 [bacterium]|nr:MAG: hypothetical protein DRQ36_08255 [bacterium]